MQPGNCKKKLATLLIIVVLGTNHSYGQSWEKSGVNNSSHLHYLFFSNLKVFFKGTDSGFYALSSHRPDKYWNKEKDSQSELLVSRIQPNGEILFVKKLNVFANRPLIRSFNNKYYLADNELKMSKKKFYYDFYVYNSGWELETHFEVVEPPHQRGVADFVVDKEGQIFLATKPYFIDHKPGDFKGSYLIKYSPAGEQLTNVLFEKSYTENLEILNDSIKLQLYHQKLVNPFYQADSIIDISCHKDLHYTIVSTRPFISRDKKIRKEIFLSDGDKLIYIDSTYFLSQNMWTSTFKLALFDSEERRRWTIEPSERWMFSTPKPLQDGKFAVQIDKRWDSTSLVIFDKAGNQQTIRSFLMNADTRIDRYSFIDFFEISEKEIWIFYKKESPSREEEIYFERLLL